MQEARICLELADTYMDELSEYAEKLANKRVTDDELNKILDEMFPVDENDTERRKTTAQKAKEEFMVCYLRPDIAMYLNTAWGVVNAMSDMVTHSEPLRKTQDYRANNWNRIMDGHKLLDRTAELVGVK